MLDKNQVLQALAAAPDDMAAMLYGEVVGAVDFRNHTFDRPVIFAGARFAERADFSRATFKKHVTFNSCVFDNPVTFRDCTFEHGAFFPMTSFQSVDFFLSTFYGTAHFWRTDFRGKADFSQVKVRRADWLPPNYDGQANFSWSCFDEKAVFTYGEFEWPVYLHRTRFKGDVYLDQCIFKEKVMVYGKQTDVLFPRFGPVEPEVVQSLEHAGIFLPDTELHREYRNEWVSEFVCFNGILSQEDLARKLEQVPEVERTAKNIILDAWHKEPCGAASYNASA